MLSLMAGGCVSQSTYDFLRADYDKVSSENRTSQEKVQELTADLEAERQRSVELLSRADALQADLEETSARLRQRTAELEAEMAVERQAADERMRKLSEEIAKARAEGSEQVSAMEAQLAEARERASRREEAAQQELSRVREQAELASRKLSEVTETYDGLVQSLKSEIEEKSVAISQSLGRIQIDLFDQVLFDSGSAELNRKGQEVLRKVAGILKKTKDRRVLVEGHTDNQQISERLQTRFPTNWELSTARAVTVVRFLESEGVPPKIMAAAGASFHRPVASNNTATGRSRNRRIEISLIPDQPTATKPVK